MKDRVSHLLSEWRFWMWKAKNYHAQRYISIITILATFGGLAIYSVNNPASLVKKVNAAGLSTYTDTAATKTLVVDSGGKFMIVPDSINSICGAGKASLWGLDYLSSNVGIKVVNSSGTYTNFKGRACIDTTNTDLTISNGSELQIAGTTSPLTFKSIKITSGGILSTPPADARGKIAPYNGRPDYWMQKFTGFVRLDPGYTYSFNPTSYDDSVVIEAGNSNGLTNSIDSTTFSVVSWNWEGGACDLDPSFFSGSYCSKTGTISIASGTVYSYTNNSSSVYYLPIRISHAENLGDATLKIRGKQVSISSGSTVYDGAMPVSWLYAPLSNADANYGKVDTNAQNKMRYEYGDRAPAFTGISRNFNNVTNYYYDPSVDLRNTTSVGYFYAFGKAADDNFNFIWKNQDPGGNPNIVTNPFNNTQRNEGFTYRIGAEPENVTDQPAIQQNDMLQVHDPGYYGSGMSAGLKLVVTGNLTVDGGKISVDGKGLPGAEQFYNGAAAGHGISGIGGQSRLGDPYGPGWIEAWGGGDRVAGAAGSAWNNTTGNAGGAGGAGYNQAGGVGGGGGGVVGQGASGREVNNDATFSIVKPVDRYPSNGNGGGGIFGVGGRLGGNSEEFVINDGQGSKSIWNANAFPGRYTYTTPAGMGGGGSLGLGSVGGVNFASGYAGSGGGSIHITVNSNIQVINSSTVSANGDNGPSSVNKAAGAGGAGSVTLIAANDFTLDNTSLIQANGGSTSAFKDDNGFWVKAGEGGGGLLRLRTTNFLGSGWTGYDCSLGKAYSGKIGSMETLGGSTLAGYGIIDLAFNPGNIPYCGSSTTIGGDVTISKQVQQWNGSQSFANSNISAYWGDSASTPTYWSNSVTTVPGAYIRVRIVIHNSDSTSRKVDVTDTLPAGFQIVSDSNSNNAYEKCSPSASCTAAPIRITAPTGTVGGAVSAQGKTIGANTNYELFYIAQVVNPL